MQHSPADLFKPDPTGALPPPFGGGIPVIMTKFERARLLATRTMQLASNAPSTLPDADMIKPEVVAARELEDGTMPLLVVRPSKSGGDGGKLRPTADGGLIATGHE